MGYKVLGWATWNGAKWFFRLKYGPRLPLPVLAGGVVLAALGVAFAVKKGTGEE